MQHKKYFTTIPKKPRFRLGKALAQLLIDIANEHLEAYQDYMAPPTPFTSADEVAERKRRKKKITALERANYIKIEKNKKGMRAEMQLTAKGKRLINELRLRAPKEGLWDGTFCIVIYDVPEPAKSLRETLRKFFKRAGFVQVQKSIWVTPANVRPNLMRFIEDLGVAEWVTCFTTRDLIPSKELRRTLNRYLK